METARVEYILDIGCCNGTADYRWACVWIDQQATFGEIPCYARMVRTDGSGLASFRVKVRTPVAAAPMAMDIALCSLSAGKIGRAHV